MSQVLPSEAQALLNGITKDPTPFFSKGIAISRTKYVFVRSDPGHAIYCRKGNEGAVAVKTNRCLLIGGYSDGMQAGCCSAVMEKLADYFIAIGYWDLKQELQQIARVDVTHDGCLITTEYCFFSAIIQ